MRPLLALLTAMLMTDAATARALGPGDEARLRNGEVLVEVTPDVGRIERVWAAEDIAAPPETVWSVMTDCDDALRYVPRLKTCAVLDADPAGRWDVRRHQLGSLPLAPDLKTTFRLEYDRPHVMRFRQVSGDMAGSEGQWRLAPLDGGRATRVFYEARLSLPPGAPGPIARALTRADAPAALQGLRRLSLERALPQAQTPTRPAPAVSASAASGPARR